MNEPQNHLTASYNRYLKVFTRQFKSSDIARRGIHDAYINLNESKTDTIDNLELFVYCSIKNSCRDIIFENRRRLKTGTISNAYKYYSTDEELLAAIETGYSPIEDIDHALTIAKEYKEVAKHLPKLGAKTQLIIQKHIFEDKSLAEVARELKSDINGTKHLFLCGKNKLKDYLDPKNQIKVQKLR